MNCTFKNTAQRRFIVRCWLSAPLAVLLSVMAALAFRLGHLHGMAGYPVAVLPALPIVWVLYETGRFLAVEKDEFERNVLIQCILGGIGGTLTATSVWGLLEDFAHVPRLDLMWIYPIFWLCAALSAPIVLARYR